MPIETFGGGDPVLSLNDTQQVTFAVMVNIEMRSEDRELTVPRPLYEYPLLKRLYKSLGGSAKIDPMWLISKNGAEAKSAPRHVELSRDMLRTESARLMREFRRPLQQGGWHSFYKDIYGEGNAGFYAAVGKLAKGYIALKQQAVAQKRLIQQEEWEALANSVEPKSADIDTIDMLEIDKIPTSDEEGMVTGDVVDPIADIQDGLVNKGWDPEIALAVVTQHAAGRCDASSLGNIPQISHKVAEIKRLFDDYRELAKAK